MEEHVQEPEWYDTARKGPFREMKFTEAAADSVVRQIHADGAVPEEVLPVSRRRKAVRMRILSAAVILLLFGAGALFLDGGVVDFTRQGGFNPLKVSGGRIAEPRVAGQANLSDEGLKEIAGQVMQEQIGQMLPFFLLERLKEPEEGIAAVHFKEREESATVWINMETGKVIRTNMNAYFTPDEIDPGFIEEALDHLREAGYTEEFTVTGLKRFVHYGTNDEPGIQTDDSLLGEEGQIYYENGVYRSSAFSMAEDEVSAEVKQAGLKAIKLLREKGTDHLYSIMCTVAPTSGQLLLTYGEGGNGATTVLMDYASQDIIQVIDYTLQSEMSSDSGIHDEQDTKLLNMDKAKLQLSAATMANEMFGIRLEGYAYVKEMSGPGTLTFRSPDGATLVSGSYNLDGVFYMIQQTPAPAK